jgi:hypothetical protein
VVRQTAKGVLRIVLGDSEVVEIAPPLSREIRWEKKAQRTMRQVPSGGERGERVESRRKMW